MIKQIKNLWYKVNRLRRGEESGIVERVDAVSQVNTRENEFYYVKDDFGYYPTLVICVNPLGEVFQRHAPLVIVPTDKSTPIKLYKIYHIGDRYP